MTVRPPDRAALDRTVQAALEHHRAGRLPAAEQLYREVLAAEPNHADALNLLGLLAQQLGRLDLARELIGKAVAASPRFAEAHNNLASVLLAQGDPAQAETHYRRAVALDPKNVGARINLGNLLWQTGRFADAAAACRAAIRLAPGAAEAHNNLGNALRDLGEFRAALDSYRRAVALKPDYAAAHSNLGNTLCDLGDPSAALPHHERALALAPGLADYHMNRGNALRDLGRLSEAYPCYQRALALQPGFGDARYNLAFAQLLGGDYAAGWRNYAARWETRKLAGHRRTLAAPAWDGSDPAGRTILVYAEQGMGDVIQFCRYLAPLRARGARTVLLIDGVWRRLEPLLRDLDGVDQLALDLADVARIDAQCALLDLPALFGTTLATVPAAIPYLAADPARRAARAALADDGLPRIGLVWAGNPDFARDHLRSPRLAPLLPLLGVPGLRWFGLQMGDGRRDLEGRALPATFSDLSAGLADFADTAAAMAELDLVITSCTATAHLSGALGRPTWVLLPAAPDWRWLLERADSPWYPTARLFRQPIGDDWSALVERVRIELVALAGGDRSRLVPRAAGA